MGVFHEQSCSKCVPYFVGEWSNSVWKDALLRDITPQATICAWKNIMSASPVVSISIYNVFQEDANIMLPVSYPLLKWALHNLFCPVRPFRAVVHRKAAFKRCVDGGETSLWPKALSSTSFFPFFLNFIASSCTSTYVACIWFVFQTPFPWGNKMISSVWCPTWVYSQRLLYLSNFPLFVSYLLFHETEACRKQSPQTSGLKQFN